jgi:hypothetical protein
MNILFINHIDVIDNIIVPCTYLKLGLSHERLYSPVDSWQSDGLVGVSDGIHSYFWGFISQLLKGDFHSAL